MRSALFHYTRTHLKQMSRESEDAVIINEIAKLRTKLSREIYFALWFGNIITSFASFFRFGRSLDRLSSYEILALDHWLSKFPIVCQLIGLIRTTSIFIFYALIEREEK